MLALFLQQTTKFYQHKVWHSDDSTDAAQGDAYPLYFDQYVDHFNNQNYETFKQKYFVNDTYFQQGGPLVLFIGGEGPLSPRTVQDVYSNEYFAKEMNGLKVALEHRFYGESFPAYDSRDLTLLSSRQAIADASMFIPFIKEQYNISKVVLLGGSYSGNLVAWMRSQLPHLVDAAIAISGPVLAENDYPEYFQHVEHQLVRYGGQECLDVMRIVSDFIDAKIQDPTSYELLADIFNCSIEEMAQYDDLDRKVWAQNIGTAIAGVVQYAKSAGYDGQLPENEIATVCRQMTQNFNESYDEETLIRDYAATLGISSQLNTGMGYHAMISQLRNTDLSTDQSSRSWMWQTCTEFGYYQTSTYENSSFSKLNDLDTMMHMCQDAYFVDLFGAMTINETKALVDDACYESNIWYGARHIPRDHIYYSNGNVDPWGYLSVNISFGWKEGQYVDGPVLIIEAGSHCSDIYMSWTRNNSVRDGQLEYLKKWLGYDSE